MPPTFWTLTQITQALLGEPAPKTSLGDKPVTAISTDSRSTGPGDVFIAIKGESLDGHGFLAKAHAAGAALLVIDRPDIPIPDGASTLLVDNTLAALHRLTRAYRDRLAASGCKVIAVAGSNGKTTTRNLIATALLATLQGTQSPASFNNHIGVPATLLAANEHHDFVVVEVGTNHPGEIDHLAAIVRPDALVITSIGYEHMEFFKTLDGVAREEADTLKHLKPGAPAFLFAEVAEHFKRLNLIPPATHTVPYAITPAHAWAADHRVQGGHILPGQTFTLPDGHKARLPLLGRHNADNALAALAVARWAGVPLHAAIEALQRAQPVGMRLNIESLGAGNQKLTLINDAYNANPSSVIAAAAVLQGLTPPPGCKRILILGDMRELGESSADLHAMTGREVAKLMDPAKPDPIHHTILIGPNSQFTAAAINHAAPTAKTTAFAKWDDNLPAHIAALTHPGDIVLLKASRGESLERLVPALKARFTA